MLGKKLYCKELKVKRRYLKSSKPEKVTQETRKQGSKEMAHRDCKNGERVGPDSVQL